jgi:predicted acyl esterase
MAHGWLRASFRKLDTSKTQPYRPYHTFDEKQPLEPSKPYELDIEIWPTCIVVPAGYRIGLSIRGKDYVYPGDLSGVPGKIGQPATGVGPFRHTDAVDRPAPLTTTDITLSFENGAPSFVMIPFVD